jgi:hypothetical protein
MNLFWQLVDSLDGGSCYFFALKRESDFQSNTAFFADVNL